MARTNQPDAVTILGEIAVQRRLVSPDQLKLCLAEQVALKGTGRNVPLGQIFIKRHLLTAEQVRELLLGQKGVEENAKLVNGKYALIRRLGRGGAGEVYLARDTSLDRPVAIKILREEMTPNRKAVERFLREAKVLARIRHTHVVGVHETGAYQGRHYFVMDYVDGKPLDAVLSQTSMTLRKRVELLGKVATAVGEVHKHGVIHRDLKPSNVLITADGNPVLLDFGLAHDVSRRTKLTVSGTILGTPFYMAPEQVSGKPVDARTDVYALGVLLYEATTGRLPFRAENEFELYRKISSHDPPHPSSVNRRVPRDIEVICLKAMEKDPRRRYADGGEFAEDLRRYLQGLPIKAKPASFGVRVIRRLKDHKIIASAVGGSLVVGVVVLGFLLAAHLRKSSAVRSELRVAEGFFREGRLAAAKTAYQRVSGMDPDNAAARDGLSRIREREGRIEKRLDEAAKLLIGNPLAAAELYREVLGLDTEHSAARKGLLSAADAADLKARRGKHLHLLDRARAQITRFREAFTKPPETFLIRDRTLPLRQAGDALEPILKELDPSDRAEAHYLLGLIHSLLDRPDRALAEMDRAVDLAPQGRYFYERGRLALRRYRREYMRAAAKFFRDEPRKKLLAELKPLRDLVQKDFERAFNSGEGDPWERDFAQAVRHYADEKYKEALEAGRRSMQKHRDAGALKLLAQICLDQALRDPAQYAEAIKWFQEAVYNYRSDPEAYAGLGTAFYYQALEVSEFTFDLKKLDQAISAYSISIRLQDSSALRLSRGKAYQSQAEWLVMMGQDAGEKTRLAHEDMKSAMQLDPEDPIIHNWLGITFIQAATHKLFRPGGSVPFSAVEEDLRNAEMAIGEAIKINRKNGDFYHNRALASGLRGMLYLLSGREADRHIDAAQRDIGTSLKLGTGDASVYEAKALTHLWKFMALLDKGNILEEKFRRRIQLELTRSVRACSEGIRRRSWNPEKARAHAFRGMIQTIRGMHSFFANEKDECGRAMIAATKDFREAGKLCSKYDLYDPSAFDSVRKAMELQLERKDPTPHYVQARAGLTKILSSTMPQDPNAYIMRLFCLLFRGFASFYLDKPKEALEDWELLSSRVPPFRPLISLWMEAARKKLTEKGPRVP